MHYRTKDCKLDIDKVDEFLNLFEEDTVEEEGSSIELSRTDLGEETKCTYRRLELKARLREATFQ